MSRNKRVEKIGIVWKCDEEQPWLIFRSLMLPLHELKVKEPPAVGYLGLKKRTPPHGLLMEMDLVKFRDFMNEFGNRAPLVGCEDRIFIIPGPFIAMLINV